MPLLRFTHPLYLCLFSSDGSPLTSVSSDDKTIVLPTEIRRGDGGEWIAAYSGGEDAVYDSLQALCAAHRLAPAVVRSWSDGLGDGWTFELVGPGILNGYPVDAGPADYGVIGSEAEGWHTLARDGTGQSEDRWASRGVAMEAALARRDVAWIRNG